MVKITPNEHNFRRLDKESRKSLCSCCLEQNPDYAPDLDIKTQQLTIQKEKFFFTEIDGISVIDLFVLKLCPMCYEIYRTHAVMELAYRPKKDMDDKSEVMGYMGYVFLFWGKGEMFPEGYKPYPEQLKFAAELQRQLPAAISERNRIYA